MDISLSPETRMLIEERLKRGGYDSADDVVKAGLASLDQQEASGGFQPGEWDALLAETEEGGPSLDGEEVFAELRRLGEQ